MTKKVSYLGAAMAVIVLVGAGCSAQSVTPTTSAPSAQPAATQPSAQPVAAEKFPVGTKVLANYQSGDYWWDATVTGISNGSYSIKYTTGGTSDTLTADKLANYPKTAASVKVGDKVIAKWLSLGWYSGTIASLEGSAAKVTWSDGSQTSVALTDIAFAGK